jgi:hypothetical protein
MITRRVATTSAFAFAVLFSPSRAKAQIERVPDASTAVSIAERAFIKRYGIELIESERPFSATMRNGVWHVSGTLYCRDAKGNPVKGLCAGGTAEADVRPSDGLILRMIHTK